MAYCRYLTMFSLVAFLLFYNVHASEIKFNSSDSAIKPLVSNNLTLTCTLQDTAVTNPVVGRKRRDIQPDALDDVSTHIDINNSPMQKRKTVTQTDINMSFTTAITIAKNGNNIATISEHFAAHAMNGASGFTVTGHLGRTGELQLVWPHPTGTESGDYSCLVDSMDSQGAGVLFNTSLSVDLDDISLSDLVNHVHRIELEKEALQTKVAQLENATAGTIVSLKATDAQYKQSIEDLKTVDSNNAQTIAQIKSDATAVKTSLQDLTNKARVEPRVFFTAAVSSNVWAWVSQNQPVKYDNIITNVGSGYDKNSASFTAPYNAYYRFDIHVLTDGNDAWLQLQHNGHGVVTARAYTDVSQLPTASNSAILLLNKGDTVNVVSYGSANSWIRAHSDEIGSNTFSGELIALA